MYDSVTNKEKNKHVVKSLALKYKQTQKRAREKQRRITEGVDPHNGSTLVDVLGMHIPAAWQ